VDEVVERLTGLSSGRAAEVPELRKEVQELAVKVDELKEAITKLRETLEKAEKMEGEAWGKNNQLLNDLYEEVRQERECGETPGRDRRTAKGIRSTGTVEESGDDMSTAGAPQPRTNKRKPAAIVRMLFSCAG
jgi:predicted nuclease with TOPRIM domain